MKKIAIGFAIVAVLLVIVALIAARNLNNYLEDNREWIASQAEAAIGRPVEIGGLHAPAERGA